MDPARRTLLVFLSAAIAVLAAVLTVVLPLSSASAQAASAAGNGVGGSHPGMILPVGSSHSVFPGEGRCGPVLQPEFVSGLCVAAEEDPLAAAANCGGLSFSAGTKVLLASGLALPIASLKVGEKVLATNTKTGKTQAETVTAVLVHHDTNRYDLRVRTSHGSAVIETTTTHLFWNPASHRWVKAAALKYGTHLRTPGGNSVTVLGGYVPADSAGWMWDLTVPGSGDHDFYIQAASSAVLVHNCPIAGGGLPRLTGSEADSFKGGVYTEQTFRAGTTFYRAEAWAARAPGRFLGTEPVDISNEAEQAYNLDYWRNARQVMRVYRLTEDTTMYFGRVAGGQGYQAFIPRGINPADILEKIGARALP